MANQIKFGIGFQVDKAGLNELQNALDSIAAEASIPSNKLNAGLQEAAKTAKIVENALEKAFNVNLGTTNISKFNQELKNNNLTIQKVKTNLSQIGPAGANAFNLLGIQILKTNVQLKESNKLLDEMAISMANTVKWGITSSIFNNMASSIQKAYGYTKNLNSSLNDIRIVTDKSAESMEKFARQANDAAKGLGASTLDYTDASLIYYQQGLDDDEVAARAETTLKAANVTGQTGEEVSEQLTAVWNGYKVTAQEAELYVDKLAAVAASTASDLEELSTGMSKVASAANAMGVDVDQLNAQLATIVSVTRQAPESVGTALKTIYARMSDLKLGETDEDGLGLGDVSGAMEKMGISIMDETGNLRDMGTVIEEVAAKWDTWSEAQKTAMAQVMAGKRQYNNLVALFENWDMYTDSLETSVNALGTLQKQQDIYMQSTEAKLQTLKTTMESVYSGLIDDNELNAGIDALTNLAQVADNFIGSFGGGLKSIAGISTIIANIFNKQIANGINNVLLNHQKLVDNANLLQTKYELLVTAQKSMQGATDPQGMAIAANYDTQVKYAEQIKNLHLSMKTEEYERLTTLQNQAGELEQQIVLEKEIANQAALKNGYTQEQIDNFYQQNTSMEEIINDAEKELNAQQEKTQELETQVDALKEIGSLAKQEQLTEAQIKDIMDIVVGIDEEILDNKEKNVKTVSDLRKLIDQINKSENNGLNANKKQTKEYQNQLKVLKQIEQAKNKTTGLSQQKNSIEQELNAAIEQQKQSADVITKVTAVSSTLSSLSMTWMSINGLMDTIFDKNISIGDKLLQGAMTFSMAIPTILSAFNKLNEVMGVTTTLTEVYNTKKAASIALASAEKTAIEATQAAHLLEGKSYTKTVASITTKIAAEEIDIATMTKAEGVRLVRQISQQNGEKLTLKEAHALWLKIVAQESETKATLAQKVAQDALNASMLANPIMIVITALVALGGAIAGVVAWQEKQLENETKLAKASMDEINKRQAEIDANTQLYNEYIKINQQYKAGITSKEDMANAADNVCKALELEGEAVAALTGDYEELTKKIIESQKKAIEEGKQEAEQEQVDAGIVLKNTARGTATDNGTKVDDKYMLSFTNWWDDTAGEESNAIAALQAMTDMSITDDGRYAITTDFSTEGIIELYDKLIEVQNKLEDTMSQEELYNSDLYKQSKEWTDKMAESVEAYKAALADIEKYSVQLAALDIDFYNIDNFDDFEAKRNQLVKALQEMPEFAEKTPEELKTITDTYIVQMNESLGIYTNQLQQIEKLTSQFGEENREEIKNWVNSLSEEELTILYSMDIENSSYEEVKNKLADISKDVKIQMVADTADSFSTLTDQFEAGELTSKNIVENESYIKIKDNLNEIKELYPELTTAAEVFANENLVGTQQWTEALYQLNEAAQEVQLNLLKEDFQEAYDKIDDIDTVVEFEAWLNSDEFESDLNELLDADYAINVEIHSQAEAEFDSITSALDDMESMASKIGEDFIVSGEDLRELNNAFPGIIKNLKDLGDGTVQLNEEVVKSAMDAAQAEIAADGKATTEKLQNAITQLRTKQAIYQSMADAARALAENESMTEDEKAKYIGVITDGLSQLDKMASEQEMENAELVATNSDENAGIMAENWANAYSSAADSAIEFANTAVRAAEVAQAGEGTVSKGDFNVNYTGRTGVSSEAGQIDNYQDLLNQENPDYAAMADSFQQAADSVGQAANDIEGMMAEAAARMQKAVSGTQGVEKGEGYSGSGKDGSGSGQEKRNAEYKNADEEIDRYWELNKAIEQVTEALSDLDKKQEKLYGRELINSLKQENELLAQQAQVYENLAAEQQKEAVELRGTLSAYGVVFDAQGGVTNYLAASQAALEQYNAAVAAYNAFLIDEATFQAAERAYENFKAQLDRYETLYYDEMVDTQNQLDDIRTKTLENNLKVWETELQIRLDLHEAERDWNDFLNEINEDFKSVFKDLGKDLNTMLENAIEYADLSGNIAVEEGQNSIPFAGTLGIDMAAMQDVMGEIDKLKNGGTSDMFSSMSEAQEKLKELINQTMEDTKALQDLYQEAWETYMEGIDQSAEKFEDLMDKFSLIDDELAYQGELIELLYGEEAYGLMNELYDAQAKNGLEQIKSLQQQKDMWYNLWQNAEEGSEEQKKYYELWTQAQGDLNDKVTEYIKLLKDDYANTIDGILKDLETKLSGGSSFDDIADEWDNITDRADNYLDNIEKMYEIQSLANKINSDIDDGSISLKNQQKLQEFRDKEIAALREKEKLTQYDLDAADARYEIMLKEIALKDAQDAKNSMKLTRGTDGNWSYQYVADEEQSVNAQQELLDAYNNYYQLADEAYAKNLQRMQELQQAYIESIREIMADETLSTEEKEAKIAEIRQRFEEDYNLLVADNTKIRDDLAIASSGLLLELFNTDKENYKQMTDNQKALVDSLISNNITDFLELENAVTTNFDGIGDKANTVMAETSEAWDSGAQGMIQNTEDIQEAINNAYDAIIEANAEYQEAVNEAAAAVGEDWSEDGIAGAIGEAEAATDSLSEATNDLVEETESNLADYKAAVEAIEEIWYAVKDAILEALEAAREYANLEPPEAPTYTPPTVPTTPGGGGNGTYGGGGGSKGGGNGNNPSGPTKKVARFLSGGYGDGVYTFSLYGVRYYTGGDYGYLSSSAKAALKGAGYTHYSRDDKYETALKTGGYTGSWTDGNPEVDNGKLAWLHQKELVLNAKDTENILDAVQTVRNLSNLSSSIEDMIMRNLSSMIIKMANIGTNVNYSTENSEQSSNNTFNITAEFPNANDVTSIREAILSLPNIASQYIHENRK